MGTSTAEADFVLNSAVCSSHGARPVHLIIAMKRQLPSTFRMAGAKELVFAKGDRVRGQDATDRSLLLIVHGHVAVFPDSRCLARPLLDSARVWGVACGGTQHWRPVARHWRPVRPVADADRIGARRPLPRLTVRFGGMRVKGLKGRVVMLIKGRVVMLIKG